MFQAAPPLQPLLPLPRCRPAVAQILIDMKEATEKGVPHPPYAEDKMIAYHMMDFLFASQDASTASLVWMVTQMAEHPDVLERVSCMRVGVRQGAAQGASCAVQPPLAWAGTAITAAPSGCLNPEPCCCGLTVRPPLRPLLLQVREEQYRLRPDIDAPITGDVLNEMAYTRQVVKEILRFRPPAPMVPQVRGGGGGGGGGGVRPWCPGGGRGGSA